MTLEAHSVLTEKLETKPLPPALDMNEVEFPYAAPPDPFMASCFPSKRKPRQQEVFIYGCGLIVFGAFLLEEIAFDSVPKAMSMCHANTVQTPQRTQKERVPNPSAGVQLHETKEFFKV